MPDLLYLMAFEQEPPLGPFNEDFHSPAALHLTLINNASASREGLALWMNYLRKLTAWYEPLNLRVAGEDNWRSSSGTVPVQLLRPATNEPTRDPYSLHLSVLDSLQASGGKVFDPTFTGEGYNPHCSWRTSKKPLRLSTLSLFQHTEGFGKGVVNLATYPLGRG